MYSSKYKQLNFPFSFIQDSLVKFIQFMEGKIKEKLQKGSPALFFLIQVLNLVFGLTAIALIGLSIWLWKQFNTFSIVEIVFMLLGVFQVLLVVLVFTARRSVAKLRCFLFFMMILFLVELISVIVVGATGQDTINKIINEDHSKQQIEQLKSDLNIVVVFCGACLAVMAFEMLFVKCYIGSLREKNNEFDYKYIDSEGQKLTLDQRNQQIKEQVSQKYSKKREQLANKYSSMKQTRS